MFGTSISGCRLYSPGLGIDDCRFRDKRLGFRASNLEHGVWDLCLKFYSFRFWDLGIWVSGFVLRV